MVEISELDGADGDIMNTYRPETNTMPNSAIPPTRVYRGTLEEVLSHRDEIPADALLELRIFERPNGITAVDSAKRRRKPSAFGKYAFVPGGSDAFALEKQQEIEREDRPRE